MKERRRVTSRRSGGAPERRKIMRKYGSKGSGKSDRPGKRGGNFRFAKDPRDAAGVRGREDRPKPLARNAAEPGTREESNEDLCWGRNPVLALLERTPSRCLKVLISKTMRRGAGDRIIELCRAAGIPFTLAEPRALDAMTGTENHQGVVATVAASETIGLEAAAELLPSAPEPALAILLDHVQDPQNLGAMIRSAEAAGAAFVALPLRRGATPTGTVGKTSAGASLRLPIAVVGNVANAVRDLQESANLWTVGLSADAKKSIYDEPLPARTLLVVGGEGKGLTKTTETACDELMRIPIEGETGSLNASVALAVAAFEWVRVNRS